MLAILLENRLNRMHLIKHIPRVISPLQQLQPLIVHPKDIIYLHVAGYIHISIILHLRTSKTRREV
jgi:hypothetical protein